MDKSDVENAKNNGNLSAKVGDVLWRQPSSIGPCGASHSHWGGDLLTVEEADARLIAAAPDMLEALQNLENDDGSMPKSAWNLVQNAIAKATGVTNANH
jgi:hypothetical protein